LKYVGVFHQAKAICHACSGVLYHKQPGPLAISSHLLVLTSVVFVSYASRLQQDFAAVPVCKLLLLDEPI
jgi:hypothetical protein